MRFVEKGKSIKQFKLNNMTAMKNEKCVFGILVLLIIGLVFISGCVQDLGPRVFEEKCSDCPDRVCFTKRCIDSNCSYSQIVPCCGNEICETKETYLTCPQDCPSPKEVLEESIPEIKDYPKLEQVFLDLYSSDGFTDSEIKYLKALFDIFKSKTGLHQADEEVLAYLATDTIEPRMPPNRNKFPDMNKEYFVEELIPLANDITEGSSGDNESIEKIVSWVRENIEVNWTAAYEIGEDTPKLILEKRKVPTACDFWATLITLLS